MEERSIRTVGILHRTREHAPVFAAVSVEGDRYPVRSWSLAWLVGVLYALQKAAQAKSKKSVKRNWRRSYSLSFERTTYFGVR
jgi:hypothetical protein